MTQTVRSKDGTSIAYEKVGSGPAIVLVLGAFNDRKTGSALAEALSGSFSVFSYDRRGRGESGDTQPYAVQREIEDLAAVLEAAGPSASVFGFSAGSVLAMRAAAAGLPISKLVLFGVPLIPEGSRLPLPPDLGRRIGELIAAGRRGEAVEVFQREAVGMPEPVIAQLRDAPFRPGLEAMAHTLVYDLAVMGSASIDEAVVSRIDMPTLVIEGEEMPEWIRRGAGEIADAISGAERRVVPGLAQHLDAGLLPPVIAGFHLG